ncbi:Cof-type HAD-IIB family hydrolase [Oceanobacillus sp. CAU 1775]
MAEIKLIALDMDGTLLNDEHEVTEENKLAIEKALEKDVHVVLSTGRSLELCYSYAQDLKLTSYIIPANGAEIYTMDKELLQRTTIDSEIMEKLYNIATQVDVGMWMISTEGLYGAFRDEAPEDFYAHEWLKFGCYTTDQKKLDLLVEEFSKFDALELSNSLPTNIEVNAKDVSKARALRYVCEKLGITMENVMACGDSLNDIKMIQEAGVGVAMANAQQAIKNVADYETTDNNNSGVAKAIEKFVL